MDRELIKSNAVIEQMQNELNTLESCNHQFKNSHRDWEHEINFLKEKVKKLESLLLVERYKKNVQETSESKNMLRKKEVEVDELRRNLKKLESLLAQRNSAETLTEKDVPILQDKVTEVYMNDNAKLAKGNDLINKYSSHSLKNYTDTHVRKKNNCDSSPLQFKLSQTSSRNSAIQAAGGRGKLKQKLQKSREVYNSAKSKKSDKMKVDSSKRYVLTNLQENTKRIQPKFFLSTGKENMNLNGIYTS